MAAQFTLNWDNTAVLAHPNSTGQRVSYRQKSVGGAWITAGFTPANDLATNVNSADTPNSLLDNVVYEFKVENLCSEGGPTINDNGVREAIEFACITPDTDQDFESASISINLTGTDITKVRFTLKRASDNTIIAGPTVVNRVANAASFNVTGLVPETNYYWQVELYANVNNIEVISSQVAYLGQPCSPYPFTTDENPVCNPVTSLDVSSVEIV